MHLVGWFTAVVFLSLISLIAGPWFLGISRFLLLDFGLRGFFSHLRTYRFPLRDRRGRMIKDWVWGN